MYRLDVVSSNLNFLSNDHPVMLMLPHDRSPGCLHAAPAWVKWLLLLTAVAIATGGFTMICVLNTGGGVIGGMIVASFGMSIIYLQCWQMCCPCQGPERHYSLGEVYSSESARAYGATMMRSPDDPPESMMFEHVERIPDV